MRPAILALLLMLFHSTLPFSGIGLHAEEIPDESDEGILLLTAALAARARGDDAAALEALERLLALDPEDATARELLAALQDENEEIGPGLTASATKVVSPEHGIADNEDVVEAASSRGAPRPGSSEDTDVGSDEIAELVRRGRAQYLNGDIGRAEQTFRRAEVLDPYDVETKRYLTLIAADRAAAASHDREKSRRQLLEEVAVSWQRPSILDAEGPVYEEVVSESVMRRKLDRIMIPYVNFNGLELAQVVAALSVLAEDHGEAEAGTGGLNIVLIDPGGRNPAVNLTLRNLSLRRILDFVAESVGFQYEVQPDAVVLRPGEGEGRMRLETEFFPVSRSTFIRMTGIGAERQKSVGSDPFGALAADPAPAETESGALRRFLQQAGIDFSGVDGSSLAFDGSAMIVTQTRRNLERIRNILNRYTDIRQVEIEAKFMEVQDGILEEFGIDWMVSSRRATDGRRRELQTGFRRLSGVGRPGGGDNAIEITSLFQQEQPDGSVSMGQERHRVPVLPPQFPGTVDLAGDVPPLGVLHGRIGEFSVEAMLRALSRREGSDLLSAPRVTVLSGNRAEIVVARELRYPERFGDVQSAVGRGGRDAPDAGVTITTGTPQDFRTRNIGVELTVTPTVEEDNYSISLDLNPRVTEFDGFVEYGGTSLAIAGGRSVTVPAGFFQPIFSVREVRTRVTTWDGATVVMGGLTREEVRTVSDRVPVIGRIPLFGKLFRSEGEASQKRNLLIFVTANLVSPGGSPRNQSLREVTPGSLYQNPVMVTPRGAEMRE